VKYFVFSLSLLLSPIVVFFALEGATRWVLPTSIWDGILELKNETLPLDSQVSTRYRLKIDLNHLPQTDFKQPSFAPKKLIKDYGYLRENEAGYVFNIKNATFRHIGKVEADGQLVYDVEYHFDDQGRRKVPCDPKNPSLKIRHLVVTGCSFVFGEGLEDNETLAAHLQKHYPGKVYNLARSGGSVVDAIALMQTTQAWDALEPSAGTALVYFSLDLHMNRFMGTLMSIGRWNQRGAFLDEDRKYAGQFRFAGLYEKDKPLRTMIGEALNQSSFLKAIEFDWPPIGDDALEAYARALLFLKQKYQEKTISTNQLVVYLRPGEEQTRRIIPFLEKYGIYYLDYSNLELEKFATKSLHIPHDGHPSEEFNRILGQQILHDLRLPGNNAKLFSERK
jgi:hypothetical protein